MTERATPRQILDVLAALAPDSKPSIDVSVDDDDMVAVPVSYTRMFEQELGRPTFPAKGGWHQIDEAGAERLIKRALLHDDEGLLRLGWLWVHGVGADRTRVRFPLVSMPVRRQLVEHGILSLVSSGHDVVAPAGEPDVTELVTDPAARQELEATIAFGGGALSGEQGVQPAAGLLADLSELLDWARRGAAAAGFPTASVTARFSDLDGWVSDVYEVVARVYLYLAQPVDRQVTIASTLRSWDGAGLADTALAAAYGLGERRVAPTGERVAVRRMPS